jgi:hypothetical protein
VAVLNPIHPLRYEDDGWKQRGRCCGFWYLFFASCAIRIVSCETEGIKTKREPSAQCVGNRGVGWHAVAWGLHGTLGFAGGGMGDGEEARRRSLLAGGSRYLESLKGSRS